MAEGSEQGALTPEQQGKIMWNLVQILTGAKQEPMGLIKYTDLMFPNGWDRYGRIPVGVWEWMQGSAKVSLEDSGSAGQPVETLNHWKAIVEGKPPFGMTLEQPATRV
jgi:hypothetical protein